MASRGAKPVLVIGLDCAAPRFIFGPQAFSLPTLQNLAQSGCWGSLRSCDPPITVPAWSVMTSGKDPGTLGVYGFRDRRDYSYANIRPASSNDITEPRLWDILSRGGKKSIVLGVPQTYPPSTIDGVMVSGILTPNTEVPFTHPASIKDELHRFVGPYQIDVADFRTSDKDGLLGRIHDFMENRFATAHYLMENYAWDFFMMVEMGMDRIHHAFWKYIDRTHPKYVPGNPYENAVRDYYEAVDKKIGALIGSAPEDACVIIVSDHGAKALHGGFCVNEWLIQQGLLVLKDRPRAITPLEDCDVDWPKTRAWASGGYCGRIFINVRGREPEGAVAQDEYEGLRDDLIDKLKGVDGPDGLRLANTVLKPEDIFAQVNGIAPDLLLYCGDLHWRAVGTVGWPGLFTDENDTGPDDANHDFEGIFIMKGGGVNRGGEIEGLSILDLAPTVLTRLGIEVPPDMQGHAVR